MLDAVGDKSDRAIGECEHHAAGMVTAKAAHQRPAGALAGVDAARRVEAARVGHPREVDLDAGDCPIAVAGPGGAVAVFRRGFAEHDRVARAIGNFAKPYAALEIGVSPEYPEAIRGDVAIDVRIVRPESRRLR